MRALKTGALYSLWCLRLAGCWALSANCWEAPLMLVTTIIAARWTIRRFAVSSAFGPRAAVGLVALGMLLIAAMPLMVERRPRATGHIAGRV